MGLRTNLCTAGRQVTVYAVLRRDQACKERGTRGRADRVRAIAMFEERAFPRKPIDVWRANVRVAITTKRRGALVIRENQHDIGRAGGAAGREADAKYQRQ